MLFTPLSYGVAEETKRGTAMCTLGNCALTDMPIGMKALDLSVREIKSLEKKEVNTPPIKKEKVRVSQKKKAQEKSRVFPIQEQEEHGNLPSYYIRLDRADYRSSEGNVYNAPHRVGEKLRDLKSGDLIPAVIDQAIKASPSVPTPVRAMMVSGPYKGSFALGKATLDRELKRILFEFTKLRLPKEDKIYAMRAEGLSPSGQIGLEGSYESQSGKFFLGELLAGAAAGIADATIQRTQNNLGNYVQEPSLANVGKQGVVVALSRTADRFAEQSRSAPEFTEIAGFQQIQIIIEEDPVEIEN